MDNKICDVNLTGTRIQNWLSEYFHRQVRIKACYAAPIGAGQEGLTSSILRVHIDYEHDQADVDRLPKSIFVKSPNADAIRDAVKKSGAISADAEETAARFISNHEKEVKAYRILNIDRPILVPILYAATPCIGESMGVIVMEDLGDKAEALCDHVTPLNFEQFREAVEALANLHAWCLTTKVNWVDHFEATDSERRKLVFANFPSMVKQGYEELIKKYPTSFDKLKSEAACRLVSLENHIAIGRKHSDKFPEVIVHGDFYANNLLFEKLSNASGDGYKIGSRLLGIVDWQLCCRGQGLLDLARCLVLNSSPRLRREKTTELLRNYYNTLRHKLGNDKFEHLSFEYVQKIYQDCFVSLGLFYVVLNVWLQNLYVQAQGEEGEKQKQQMFERCLAVYEDVMEILKW